MTCPECGHPLDAECTCPCCMEAAQLASDVEVAFEVAEERGMNISRGDIRALLEAVKEGN